MKAFDIDAIDLAKEMVITVRIKNIARFTFRCWLVKLLVILADFIAPFSIVFDEDTWEPWLAYCPYCARDFATRKPRANIERHFLVHCHHCDRQCLARVTGGIAEIMIDTECDYGCHFTEPYGFVPQADCPIHD